LDCSHLPRAILIITETRPKIKGYNQAVFLNLTTIITAAASAIARLDTWAALSVPVIIRLSPLQNSRANLSSE